jgi:hypothetical protein
MLVGGVVVKDDVDGVVRKRFVRHISQEYCPFLVAVVSAH